MTFRIRLVLAATGAIAEPSSRAPALPQPASTNDDVSGPCDEAEHADDPRCTANRDSDDDGRSDDRAGSGPDEDDGGSDDDGSGDDRSGSGGDSDSSGSDDDDSDSSGSGSGESGLRQG